MCCLCLASPEKVLIETAGKLEGNCIIDTPAGENGFGYDPIFFVPELNKTVAQMTSEEKNAISHRGNAIRSLKLPLRNFCDTSKCLREQAEIFFWRQDDPGPPIEFFYELMRNRLHVF